jgi:hypothetical protein
MLASITPLGERSRLQRWWLTVAALIAGATAASAAVGAVLSALGGLVAFDGERRLELLLAVAALGVAVELVGVPTHRRQVDDAWLRRYRGWVYGLGFGVQLGVGVSTIVTTAAVYVLLAAELLAPSVAAGAAMGAAFGLVRGATLLTAARVDSPQRLAAFHRGFRRLERTAGWAAIAAQAAVVAAVALTL